MADINVGQIAEALNEKMDRNLANTDAIGQAILDKKVEVEALLEQNGYAKFTWKEGNNISKLLLQWGYAKNIPFGTAISFPVSFQFAFSIAPVGIVKTPQSWLLSNLLSLYSNEFTFLMREVNDNKIETNCMYIAIGY